jgi:hypothetical protein
MKKLTLTIISLLFAALVLTTMAADRLVALSFRTSPGTFTLEERLELIKKAIKLDQLNAELHFKKFQILQEIRLKKGERRPHKSELYAIKDAIDLRPLWPKYHLYYGLVLEKMNPDPNIMTKQLILSQLKKAHELKPYSSLYEKKYLEYTEKYRD